MTPAPGRRRRWIVTSAVTVATVLASTLLVTTATTAAAKPSSSPASAPSSPSASAGRAAPALKPVPRPAAPVSDRFAAKPVRWGPCDPDDFWTTADGTSLVPPTYQCADYEVPLDYTKPRGRTVTLALIRRPADDPSSRQGTIFLNPGGPGGSGVDTVADAGEFIFGPEVRASFDLVGFDPRGVARSEVLRCYPTSEAFFEDLATNEFQRVWPETDAEYRAATRDALDLARDCKRRAGPVIGHMGTSTVAKDLDVLRRAVGDRQLNFIGYSYGTYVCAQYIAQYPDRVGAVACDANIDPVEYATGEPALLGHVVPMFARARTEVGTNATLEEFFRLCDAAGPENCTFAPNSSARYADLYATLRVTPLELAEGVFFDEQLLVANTNGPLYNSLFGWQFLAGFLTEIEALAAGGTPPAPPEDPEEPGEPDVLPPVNEQYQGFEYFYGVSCSDNRQPRFFQAWRWAIERAPGYFGPFWASGDYPCPVWPAYDPGTVLGPFTKRTPNPVLIVNTRFDPATPYEDAVDHYRRLPNAALLTVEGWGHVGQGLSACGDAIIDEYFLTRRVPARTMTCTQDVTPFDPALFAPPAPAGDTPDPAAGAVATEVVDTAVGTALGTLAEGGTPAEAVSAATEIAVQAVEAAGDEETAGRLRARQAVLDQAVTGAPRP